MISVSCLKVVGSYSYVCLSGVICTLLLCFHSTSNGIERSSPSHHPINVVLLFGIYICMYIICTDPRNGYLPGYLL